MALISIILGILLDRNWTGLKQWQQFGWFSKFSAFVLDKTDKHLHNPTLRYLSVLAIPVLGVMVLQEMTASWLSPVSFLFAFVVFVYCLGSLEVEQSLEQLIKAINDKDTTNTQSLIEEITSESGIEDENILDTVIQSSMNTIIDRLFGVIFWFAILGPVGAIIYRLSQELKTIYSDDPVLAKSCERMLYLLNWIPARFLAISFAITGHFEGALAAYHENKETDRTQQYLLIDICHGALEGNETDERAAYLSAFRGLVLRSLIVWLTCIALLTLLGWN